MGKERTQGVLQRRPQNVPRPARQLRSRAGDHRSERLLCGLQLRVGPQARAVQDAGGGREQPHVVHDASAAAAAGAAVAHGACQSQCRCPGSAAHVPHGWGRPVDLPSPVGEALAAKSSDLGGNLPPPPHPSICRAQSQSLSSAPGARGLAHCAYWCRWQEARQATHSMLQCRIWASAGARSALGLDDTLVRLDVDPEFGKTAQIFDRAERLCVSRR